EAEPVIRTLLAADLKDHAGLLLHAGDRLPLVYRQRQRLLAVNVLTGAHGGDCDKGVPVVRRADDYRVDVLAGQQFAEVVELGAVRRELHLLRGVLAMVAVHVANGNDLRPRVAGSGFRVVQSLLKAAFRAAGSDAADLDRIV